MKKQHVFNKVGLKITGLLLLTLLILNLAPARTVGAETGNSQLLQDSFLPPSVCESNVAETSQYTMVYQLSIPTNVDYNGAIPPYSVNNSGSIGAFNRVGYCLQLDGNWVWVSMDAFTAVPAQIGVPVASTGAVFQQIVNNMNVASNVGGVVTGTGITTGNIEFWHHCYNTGALLGLPGANSSTYDFDDTFNGASCYGSMQVHNHGATQTVFAWNGWETGSQGEVGIGNNPGTHPDWTFQPTAANYTTRLLTIYAQASLIVTTADDVVDANGGSCAGMPLASLPGPDGLLSLREAICAANANAGADTITFDSSLDGTPITLSILGVGEEFNVTGDLDIRDDLTIIGNGARNTIVNANNIDGVFDIPIGGITVTLNDMTIQNGDASDRDGGGIYNAGTLTINRSTIADNSVTFGSNNGGGGIFNIGTLTINNSTVANNSANGGSFDSGGGLFNTSSGTATINNSTFSDNNAGLIGGAIFDEGTAITIRNSTFSGNIAGAFTGGIFTDGAVDIQNSIITNSTGSDCDDNAGTGTLTGSNNLTDDFASAPCSAISSAAVTNFNTTLANNGGSTDTHALLVGSNAIDTGSASCPNHAAVPLSQDQRGVNRPQDGNGDSTATCDIGAFELGTITCGIQAAGEPGNYVFDSMAINVTDDGSNLACIRSTRIPRNHPNGTAPIQGGEYWDIEGLQADQSTAATVDFIFNITLAHNVAPNINASVCKYPGGMGGAGWDCARTGSNVTQVWRDGISTGFSDWAVGNQAGPTAVTLLQQASTSSPSTWGWLAAVLLLAGGSFALLRRRIA